VAKHATGRPQWEESRELHAPAHREHGLHCCCTPKAGCAALRESAIPSKLGLLASNLVSGPSSGNSAAVLSTAPPRFGWGPQFVGPERFGGADTVRRHYKLGKNVGWEILKAYLTIHVPSPFRCQLDCVERICAGILSGLVGIGRRHFQASQQPCLPSVVKLQQTKCARPNCCTNMRRG